MLSRINFEDHTICTLGSHCSLQVLKGAKDEGFKTLLICEKKRENLYRRFSFIDDFIIVDKFRDILKKTVFQKLPNEKVYMIPHGTLISNFQIEEIENLRVPFFGNKYILRWEADRELKQKIISIIEAEMIIFGIIGFVLFCISLVKGWDRIRKKEISDYLSGIIRGTTLTFTVFQFIFAFVLPQYLTQILTYLQTTSK